MFKKQFTDVQDAWTLANAIVDTVREPLVVLGQDLRVIAASQSFYLKFKVKADDTLWQAPVRPGRRSMGYSKAAPAIGKNSSGAGSHGKL